MAANHAQVLKHTPGHTGPHLKAPESPVPVHSIDSSNRYNVNHFEPLLHSFLASLAAKHDQLSNWNANPLDSAMVIFQHSIIDYPGLSNTLTLLRTVYPGLPFCWVLLGFGFYSDVVRWVILGM